MPRALSRAVVRRWAVLTLLLIAGPASAQDLSGSWRGRWQDTRSGHQGPLRARLDGCDGSQYHAVFTGRFFGVVPFRFATDLNVVASDGEQTILAGQSRLPLFGSFTYHGQGSGDSLVVDFCSRRYVGRFTLCRTGH